MFGFSRKVLQTIRPIIAVGKSTKPCIELPAKPAKPLTPYLKFIKDVSPTIRITQKSSEHIGVTKIRVMAKLWNDMNESEKSKYQQGFAEDRASYALQMLEYKNKLTMEQQIELLRIDDQKRQKKQSRYRKKQNVKLGKPKRFISAFLYFQTEQLKQTSPNGDRQRIQLIREKWATLSESEKKPYFDLSKKHREIYSKELLEWEERMIGAGNFEVVRHKTLNTKGE